MQCPTLPNTGKFKQQKFRRILKRLEKYLICYAADVRYVSSFISSLESSEQVRILFNLELFLLRKDCRLAQTNMLRLLQVSPKVAEVIDCNGKSLLHYVLLQESFNADVAFRLISMVPSSVEIICATEYGPMNCLQIVLSKADVNYKLAYLMMCLCPNSIR